MGKKGCILIADDKGEILESLKQLLKYDYAQIITTDDPEQIPALLAQHPVDLVLLDMNFRIGKTSGEDGLNTLFSKLTSKVSLVPGSTFINLDSSFDSNPSEGFADFGITDFINFVVSILFSFEIVSLLVVTSS